jgi:uncharacterized membrane protein YidH (DUF202 family)
MYQNQTPTSFTAFLNTAKSRRFSFDSSTGITVAHERTMIDVTLSILALIAGGVTLEVFGASWRPSGQDERGFKLTAKVAEGPEEYQSGNPS